MIVIPSRDTKSGLLDRIETVLKIYFLRNFNLILFCMKNFTILTIVILLIPFFSILAGDEPVLEMDRTFETYSGLTLHYTGISGDLDISTWDKNEVNVKVYANANAKERMEIKVVDGNGGITISESSRYSSARGHDIRLRYEIILPSSYNVTINTSSSDQKIKNLTGNIHIQSSSGDIMLNNLNGNVTISNSSGNVSGNGIIGDIVITTASGDIFNSNVTGRVTVTSASGDITIKDATESVNLSTVSGDIVLVFSNENPGATLNTTSGDIEVQLGNNVGATVLSNKSYSYSDVSGNYNNNNNRNEEFYGGGNMIHCSTTSGDVTIEEAY